MDFATAAELIVVVPEETEDDEPLELRGRTQAYIRRARAKGGAGGAALEAMDEEPEGVEEGQVMHIPTARSDPMNKRVCSVRLRHTFKGARH